MNKRIMKKKDDLERYQFTKLMKKECDRHRHSSIGFAFPNGTVVGAKGCFELNIIEFMYVKYKTDPYRVGKVCNAMKHALFDIHIEKALCIDSSKNAEYRELFIENKELYLHTSGDVIKSSLYILNPSGDNEEINKSTYLLDYITDEIKLIPKNKDAERAIEYLDQFIVSWACNLMFCNHKLSDEYVAKIKSDLKKILKKESVHNE